MKLKLVPPRQGMQWVRQGMRAFAARPLAYMGLIGLWMLTVALAQLLSLPGTLLMWAALPSVSLGFMLATQEVVNGRLPTVQLFLAPLQAPPTRRRALWLLGGLYALAMVLAVGSYALLFGADAAPALPEPGPGPAQPAGDAGGVPLYDPRLPSGLLWVATAAAVLSVPFWHAPALVYWGGQSTAQALFSSTVAVWRNKAAFLVYALTGASAFLAVAVGASMIVSLLGVGHMQAVALLVMPVGFILTAVFYASLYFTFIDCFELPSRPSSPVET